MVAGDLHPSFSNTYPEILAPWIRETDFRKLIEALNTQLALTFAPSGTRAWVDTILGFATGWLWDDIGASKAKAGVRKLEAIVEEWNEQRQRENLQSSMGLSKDEEQNIVRCVELRRTGFMSLDIVIPDPRISLIDEEQRSLFLGGTRPTTRPGSAGGGVATSSPVPRPVAQFEAPSPGRHELQGENSPRAEMAA